MPGTSYMRKKTVKRFITDVNTTYPMNFNYNPDHDQVAMIAQQATCTNTCSIILTITSIVYSS